MMARLGSQFLSQLDCVTVGITSLSWDSFSCSVVLHAQESPGELIKTQIAELHLQSF